MYSAPDQGHMKTHQPSQTWWLLVPSPYDNCSKILDVAQSAPHAPIGRKLIAPICGDFVEVSNDLMGWTSLTNTNASGECTRLGDDPNDVGGCGGGSWTYLDVVYCSSPLCKGHVQS
ncbi:uncharacterized protein EI90DRAFT_3013571 [Cantharellus anzutake]|uniref:uncharacterized protein n=1 Tax=Cantharellus anzutake TaxID=1750568 RepID=UPI001906F52B|nr:uncharacterized protein EI90DRAFT_3013571 [Cantharellus anzutake]KAF8337317.1 hypothetical protein EI90DRAFT_3013571 [Cantharellus anzutake]